MTVSTKVEGEIALRRKRAHVHAGGTIGERIADRAASVIGSWRFIIIQTVGVVLWVGGNLYEAFHFDPFPFILLNLMFSVQAAYTGPILLLAANRSAQKDRLRDDRDDAEIGEILEVARSLHGMQQDQMAHDKNTMTILKQLQGRYVADKQGGGGLVGPDIVSK